MFARNLLFILLCLIGLAAVAANLLQETRMLEPESFDPGQYDNGEFTEVVQQINAEFHADWVRAGLEPAPPANDLLVARRISLALAGTIPSLEEIRTLEDRPAAHRIQWWLTHVLEDRRYADYVAERLARVFVGTEDGPFLIYRRRRFVSWLSDRLEENTPYDELVETLITDTGLWTDSPAANFITVTFDQNGAERPDEAKLAGRVARAFLGVRLDCVRCHDDMLGGDWRQSDFHGLAAYFSETKLNLTGLQDEPREYEFQYLDREETEVVRPQVPFQRELIIDENSAANPNAVQVPRRQALARWVTHSENLAFARTTVNRVWALMFSRPLIDPVDSVPLDGPYPAGMEILARDFVQHDYDLQRLIRLIAQTDAFRRSSQADSEITEAHEERWAAFPLSRLRPEQVAGSVLQAASLETIDAESHIFVQLQRFGQQNDFLRRYGDTGEDEFTIHGGTIPQRLVMMNGNLVKERTEDNLIINASTRIAALAPDGAIAVEAAYLATLSRRPTANERDHFSDKLTGTRGRQRSRVMEDVYWTLLNSTEFSWNH